MNATAIGVHVGIGRLHERGKLHAHEAASHHWLVQTYFDSATFLLPGGRGPLDRMRAEIQASTVRLTDADRRPVTRA